MLAKRMRELIMRNRWSTVIEVSGRRDGGVVVGASIERRGEKDYEYW